jgi:hypothetical protein
MLILILGELKYSLLLCAAWENRGQVSKYFHSQALKILRTSSPDSPALEGTPAPSFDSPKLAKMQRRQHFRVGVCILCGLGESNSRLILGKDSLYHLTKAAILFQLF